MYSLSLTHTHNTPRMSLQQGGRGSWQSVEQLGLGAQERGAVVVVAHQICSAHLTGTGGSHSLAPHGCWGSDVGPPLGGSPEWLGRDPSELPSSAAGREVASTGNCAWPGSRSEEGGSATFPLRWAHSRGEKPRSASAKPLRPGSPSLHASPSHLTNTEPAVPKVWDHQPQSPGLQLSRILALKHGSSLGQMETAAKPPRTDGSLHLEAP